MPILAAALLASALNPLSAAPINDSSIGYTVSRLTVASSGYEQIARGATQGTVSRVMGSPFRELAPDVWAYHGYHANLDLANAQGCDTLIVTFARGKVADLKLVNRSAAELIAANSQSGKSTGLYAARN
jgi:predicted secreted hydrolase